MYYQRQMDRHAAAGNRAVVGILVGILTNRTSNWAWVSLKYRWKRSSSSWRQWWNSPNWVQHWRIWWTQTHSWVTDNVVTCDYINTNLMCKWRKLTYTQIEARKYKNHFIGFMCLTWTHHYISIFWRICALELPIMQNSRLFYSWTMR